MKHSASISFLSFIIILAGHLMANEPADNFLKLAEKFFHDSLYSQALENYQRYLKLTPLTQNNAFIYYKIGLCHFRIGEIRKAAETFEGLINFYSDTGLIAKSFYYAALSREKLGHFREASMWFFLAWSRNQQSLIASEMLFKAAVCAEKDSNLRRASEFYTKYIERFPNDSLTAIASFSNLKILLQLKEFKTAKALIKKLETQWKNNELHLVRLLFYKGMIAQLSAETAMALQYYSNFISKLKEQTPELQLTVIQLTELLQNESSFSGHVLLNNYEEIVRLLERLHPNALTWELLFSYADKAYQFREFRRADSLYSKLFLLFPANPQTGKALYKFAENQLALADTAAALSALEKILLMQIDSAEQAKAILKLADMNYSRMQFAAAFDFYRRFVRLESAENKDHAFYRLGLINFRHFKREINAIDDFQVITRDFPASPYFFPSIFEIGRCYEALGNYQAAIRYYNYLLDFNPDTSLIRQANERKHYIKLFCFVDSLEVANQLSTLLEYISETTAEPLRLFSVAFVHETVTKDFSRALQIYNRIYNNSSLSDSIRLLALMKTGMLYMKLSEKASFDENESKAKEARAKAEKVFSEIVDKFAKSEYADDAQYHLILLSADSNISTFEKFISSYPNSNYLPQVYLTLARLYEQRISISHKYLHKSIAVYSTIVQKNPQNHYRIQGLLGLARCYLYYNKFDSLNRVLDELMVGIQNPLYEPEVLFIRGKALLKQKRFASAEEVFRSILAKYPLSFLTHRCRYEMAYSQMQQGKIALAMENYQQYLQSRPPKIDADRARLELGKCLIALKYEKEALQLYDSLLAQPIERQIAISIHKELANLFQIRGETENAITHYNSIVSLGDPASSCEALRKMGQLYYLQDRYEKAAQQFGKSLLCSSNSSDSCESMMGEIQALIMLNKKNEASKKIKVFKSIFGQDKENMARIEYCEALRLIVEKKYSKAIERFNYIISKYRGTSVNDDAEYQIALCFYYDNKKTEAIERLNNFLIMWPKSEFVPSVHFKIGLIYYREGDYYSAAEHFRKTVEGERVRSELKYKAAYNAAQNYQKVSQWLDAAKMYKVMLESDSGPLSRSSIYINIGFCYIQAFEYMEALKNFSEAKQCQSIEEGPEILYWTAYCYAKIGEYQKAAEEFLLIPNLFPDHGKWGITAEFEAAKVFEQLGEYGKARALYEKIVLADGSEGAFGKKANTRILNINKLISGKGL